MPNSVRILVSAKDEASAAFDRVQRKADALGKTDFGKGVMQGLGIAAFGGVQTAALGALEAVGRYAAGSIDAASDQREAMSLTTQVFEDSTASVKEWAKNKKDAFSATEALNFAAQFGTAFKNVGMTLDDTTAKAEEMTTLAGDLGSAFNKSSAEAATALRSGLLGESEPLRAFGIFLDEAKVKAKAAAMGMEPLNGALSDGQKVAARYALIMEQTADSQGMFGRDVDSLADKSKRLESNLADLQAGIGEGLVPALADATQGALDLMDAFDTGSDTPAADRISAVTDALDALNPWTWSTAAGFDAMGSAVSNFTDEQLAAAADGAEAWDTGSERIGAAFGSMADDAKSSSSTTTGALDKVKRKAVDVAKTLGELGQEAADSYFDPMIAEAELATVKLDLQEAIRVRDSKDSTAEQVADAKLRILELRKRSTELQVELIGYGKMNKAEQEKFLANLRAKWKKATGDAKLDIAALIAKIEDIPSNVTVNINAKTHFTGTGNDSGRAAGGPTSPYQSYAYQENGPEILTMGSGSGRVFPSVGGAPAAASTAAPTLNLTVVNQGVLTPGAARALADQLGPYLNRWGQAR